VNALGFSGRCTANVRPIYGRFLNCVDTDEQLFYTWSSIQIACIVNVYNSLPANIESLSSFPS